MNACYVCGGRDQTRLQHASGMINKPPEYALRPRRHSRLRNGSSVCNGECGEGVGEGVVPRCITCMQVCYFDWIALICSILVLDIINVVNTTMQGLGLGLVALIGLGLRGVWGLRFPLEWSVSPPSATYDAPFNYGNYSSATLLRRLQPAFYVSFCLVLWGTPYSVGVVGFTSVLPDHSRSTLL
jgi:hypothetical protein